MYQDTIMEVCWLWLYVPEQKLLGKLDQGPGILAIKQPLIHLYHLDSNMH